MSTGSNQLQAENIKIPNLWLGNGLTSLINSGNYNVYIDFDYSLYLSTSADSVTWVTTLGSLNALDNPLFIFGNKGSSKLTRIGNTTYTQINTRLAYNKTPANVSNFQVQLNLSSILMPYFDIYVPSSNNFKITLSPLV